MSWQAARREPFRVLFPLGAICGCVGAVWYALGWHASYSWFYHASVQMGGYMLCFVIGFFMTALPRLTAAPIADTWELMAVLVLLCLQMISLWWSHWIIAALCFAGLLIVLACFAGRRVAQRRNAAGPPTEFVWIPAAIVSGCVGAVLLIGGHTGFWLSQWMALGRPMLLQGILLAMVLGVGGFLIPRLLGRPLLLVTPPGVSARALQSMQVQRLLCHALAMIALAVSFWLES